MLIACCNYHIRLLILIDWLFLYQELLVSELCSLDGKRCQVPWIAKPSMDLLSVQIIMDRHGVNQVPVVSEHIEDHKRQPVGLLDRECISVTFRFLHNI